MNALTWREAQLAELIAQGKSNRVIAASLHLSEGTIREYLYRMFRKLRLRNRTGLAVWWISADRTRG
jgi:DNA-binding NarL/FixJ family response regulator